MLASIFRLLWKIQEKIGFHVVSKEVQMVSVGYRNTVSFICVCFFSVVLWPSPHHLPTCPGTCLGAASKVVATLRYFASDPAASFAGIVR